MPRARATPLLAVLGCASLATSLVLTQHHAAATLDSSTPEPRAYAPALSADSRPPADVSASPTAPQASVPTATTTIPATPSTLPTSPPTVAPTTTPPRAPTPAPLRTATVTLTDGAATATLTVELATTPADHARGLMFRTELPDSEGMLFVFSRDDSGAFWMKDTYIPLDIAWIDASGVVLGIAYGQPLDLTGLEPPSPYRFVLEVAGGWFERHNMAAGAVVQLPADLVPPDAP
jgi:uncharacterized membrane protein (UPF0127 family)